MAKLKPENYKGYRIDFSVGHVAKRADDIVRATSPNVSTKNKRYLLSFGNNKAVAYKKAKKQINEIIKWW